MAITATATPFLVMFLDTKPSRGSTIQECWLFMMGLLNKSIITGCRMITVKRDKSTPFASTKPRSYPMPNCMKKRATKPPMVVSALAEMEASVLGRAEMMASRGLSFMRSSS